MNLVTFLGVLLVLLVWGVFQPTQRTTKKYRDDPTPRLSMRVLAFLNSMRHAIFVMRHAIGIALFIVAMFGIAFLSEHVRGLGGAFLILGLVAALILIISWDYEEGPTEFDRELDKIAKESEKHAEYVRRVKANLRRLDAKRRRADD